MVTARPATRAPYPRSRRVGLRRLLWLAALLVGLLYSHGISAESAEGHVSPLLAVSTAQAPVSPVSHEASVQYGLDDATAGGGSCRGDGHDGHEAGHAAHDCLAGNPEHGVDLPLPSACSAGAAPTVHASLIPTGAAAATSGVAPNSSPPMGGSTVLRI
ncbi:hypothetical protein ACIQU6_20515 [Streptomyces sp. NPDC090442]|uniref:hypothetical protein n=1 Tax=Streptomyces sp. NPDC090442 TaxID=3365962 RepID=UPI00382D5C9B